MIFLAFANPGFPLSLFGLPFLLMAVAMPAATIAELYRQRWQIELFIRWVKQSLRIRTFYGTTPNAVRVQLYISRDRYHPQATRTCYKSDDPRPSSVAARAFANPTAGAACEF